MKETERYYYGIVCLGDQKYLVRFADIRRRRAIELLCDCYEAEQNDPQADEDKLLPRTTFYRVGWRVMRSVCGKTNNLFGAEGAWVRKHIPYLGKMDVWQW